MDGCEGNFTSKKSRNYMGDDETRWTYSRSENGQLLSVSEKSTMKGSLEIRNHSAMTNNKDARRKSLKRMENYILPDGFPMAKTA